ncbi:MAG: hypothetical protein AB7F64_09745 [Gammaproteobacteria bacterium]
MSYASAYTIQELGLYLIAIKELEENAGLVRALEYLPDDKIILDRKASQLGLTRPELAVLLAYTKIYIKKEILNSDIPSDPYFKKILESSFAEPLQKAYQKAIVSHRLRREIIATELSNDIVNDMGVTFIFRMQTETDATIPEIIKAFTVVAKVFEYHKLKHLIDSVGYKISLNVQYEILEHLKHHISICTRWFLRENRMRKGIVATIKHFYEPVKSLFDVIPKFMVGATKSYLDTLTTQFAEAGLPEHYVQRIAGSRAMYNALNIIEVSSKYKFDLVKTTELYLSVGAFFNLVWFRDQLVLNTLEGFWNTLARVNLRDKLDTLQKTLTIIILSSYKAETQIEQMISLWADKNNRIIQRWKSLQEKLHESSNLDFNIYFVALNELMSLLPVV